MPDLKRCTKCGRIGMTGTKCGTCGAPIRKRAGKDGRS